VTLPKPKLKPKLRPPKEWPDPGDGWALLPEQRLLEIAEHADHIRSLLPKHLWFQFVEHEPRETCPTCNGKGWVKP